MAAGDQQNGPLTRVWFSSPVEGVDPTDGATIVANRHSIPAAKLVQDRDETIFMDGDGQILGRWPTRSIECVEWPRGFEPDEEVPTGSKAWRSAVQSRHVNAYRKWTEPEEEQLRSEFDAGMTPGDMAIVHGRQVGGIEARLLRLGLIPDNGPTGP